MATLKILGGVMMGGVTLASAHVLALAPVDMQVVDYLNKGGMIPTLLACTALLLFAIKFIINGYLDLQKKLLEEKDERIEALEKELIEKKSRCGTCCGREKK